MNKAIVFLQHAQKFCKQEQYTLAGLYASTALFFRRSDETTLSEEWQEQYDAIVQQLPQRISEYEQQIITAKSMALKAREQAFAPFSHFLVGATLIAYDGTMIDGCNVEASSYGLTICAERTALVSAVVRGKQQFIAVVVAADTKEMTPPCGACRQMLYDFAPDALVILINLEGQEKRFTMKELLPEAFSVTFLQS